ncbi:hypothetical protein MMC28_002933 [Mycoblastus sanguinarius]|nr:hypothetical protein [Mycoblastus sanguinarius]
MSWSESVGHLDEFFDRTFGWENGFGCDLGWEMQTGMERDSETRRTESTRRSDLDTMNKSPMDLIASLRQTKLKRLLLHADMYNITADSVSTVGSQLRFLEDLTSAFDYQSWKHQMASMESFLPEVLNLRRNPSPLSAHQIFTNS